MPAKKEIPLHVVDKDLLCLQCGHKGAVKTYGIWHPNGSDASYIEDHNKPYMEPVFGPGGTIPWECTNCGNYGLEGIGMEGYKVAFERTKGSESK